MSRVLEVTGLEGGYGAVQILYGIDLHVDEGEFVTIIGPKAFTSVSASTICGSICQGLHCLLSAPRSLLVMPALLTRMSRESVIVDSSSLKLLMESWSLISSLRTPAGSAA